MQTPQIQPTGRESCPLTAAQQLALDVDTADPDNQLSTLRCRWMFYGPLERSLVIDCLREIVRNNGVLRTQVHSVDGVDNQTIADGLPPPEVSELDLRGVSRAKLDQRVGEISNHVARRFELGRESLLRAALLQLADDGHLLVVALHHIAFDAGSVPVMFGQLRAGYQALLADPDAEWPRPPLQYMDLAAYLDQVASSPAGEAHRAYWHDRLSTAPGLELPVDRSREVVDAARNAAPRGIAVFGVQEATATISQDVRAAIATLGREERASPYMVQLAGFVAALHRRTGQDDLCVQSTYSLRGRPELATMLGYVGNPLVMRVDTSGNPSFRELIHRVRNVVLSAWAHGEIPVIGWAPHDLRRVNFNYIPISDTTFEPTPFAPEIDSLRVRVPVDLERVKTPFDLQLWLLDSPTACTLRVFAPAPLFSARAIDSLLRSYVDDLGALTARPDAPLSR